MQTPTPRKHLHHQTPHWVNSDAIYFVTACAARCGQNHFCHPALGSVVLASISFYHKKETWFCHLAVLMPDHIHLLVCLPPERTLSQVIGLWKQGLARKNKISWQRNFFEHRLRYEESIEHKADYILQNPVRAGLVAQIQDWRYVWMPGREISAARDSGGYL